MEGRRTRGAVVVVEATLCCRDRIDSKDTVAFGSKSPQVRFKSANSSRKNMPLCAGSTVDRGEDEVEAL